MPDVHLHIGGEARTSGAGGVHQHVYPATGEVQGPVPLAGPDDVDAAVQAAQAATRAWRAWTPWQRRECFVGSPSCWSATPTRSPGCRCSTTG